MINPDIIGWTVGILAICGMIITGARAYQSIKSDQTAHTTLNSTEHQSIKEDVVVLFEKKLDKSTCIICADKWSDITDMLNASQNEIRKDVRADITRLELSMNNGFNEIRAEIRTLSERRSGPRWKIGDDN